MKSLYTRQYIYTHKQAFQIFNPQGLGGGWGYTDRGIGCKHEFLLSMETLISDKNNTLIYIFV